MSALYTDRNIALTTGMLFDFYHNQMMNLKLSMKTRMIIERERACYHHQITIESK